MVWKKQCVSNSLREALTLWETLYEGEEFLIISSEHGLPWIAAVLVLLPPTHYNCSKTASKNTFLS